jgi:hypothetical protein
MAMMMPVIVVGIVMAAPLCFRLDGSRAILQSMIDAMRAYSDQA